MKKRVLFTVAPVLAAFGIMFYPRGGDELQCNSSIYERDGHEYKRIDICHPDYDFIKRTEFYKAYLIHGRDEQHWVKDSTWIYFSASGDTLKQVTYRDGVEIK